MKKLIVAVLATSSAMIVHAQAESAGKTGPANEFRTEMRALIRGDGMDVAALANLLQERSQARFETIDADGDGALTREEVLAAADERAQKRFERMDRNGDGVLKRSDGEGFARHHRDGRPQMSEEQRAERLSERAQKRFSRLDGNDDGMLSPEEFEEGMKQHAERMQERHEERRDRRAERREERAERRAEMPQELREARREMRALLREGADLERFTAAMQERASARFDALDADKDGKLVAGEFTARLAQHAERMFARMDRNDDGLVTRDDRRGGKHRGRGNDDRPEETPEE